ncbi:SHOCT domain-containing protein [Paramicrobacterium agarici]|uniref:SHOCT domain-containing protein n=1 Tax=Paramicrobacterium agarici TaxID=630514 RepID=UPI0011528DCE|nr:SHOCT domain-containing protein [Microbacterium agarici]TQO22834.1 putative oligomerization/nucleic acid binding protein [Microbacterium agarici]
MLGNLSGWHLMIIVAVMLVIIAVIAAVVVAILVSRRRSAPMPPPTPSGTAARQHPAPPVRTTEQRLAELDELRQRGVVSDVEYAQKREQILREL